MKKSEKKLLGIIIGGYILYKIYYKHIKPVSKDVISTSNEGLKTTPILSTSITGRPIYLPPGAVS